MPSSRPAPHPDRAARPLLKGWQRAVAWALALAAMTGVFALYVQPDFMVLMADQVWACF